MWCRPAARPLEPLNRGATSPGRRSATTTSPASRPRCRSGLLPRCAPAPPGPALLDIHGGGFVVGSIQMEYTFATLVARTLDVVVVTPEYRLAPETRSRRVDDCYATLQW